MAEDRSLPDKNTGRFIGKKKALPLQSNILKIIVGEGDDTQAFHIHEAVLTARSKFFKAAMGKQWKESEDKIVKLPKDDPEVFQLYAQLVYTGRIPSMNNDVPESDDVSQKHGGTLGCCNTELECKEEYELLCGLYVFAEKMLDWTAKNETIKALVSKINTERNKTAGAELRCIPSVDAIKTIYNGTSTHCPGRQLMVDCYIWCGDEVVYQRTKQDLPAEFLDCLIWNLMSSRQASERDYPIQWNNGQSTYYQTEKEEWYDDTLWGCIE